MAVPVKSSKKCPNFFFVPLMGVHSLDTNTDLSPIPLKCSSYAPPPENESITGRALGSDRY